MSSLGAIARTGVVAVLLHPLRSVTTLACLIAILLPYLVGAGIARGVLDEAQVSIARGADLYVSGTRFGRPAPFPASQAAVVRAIPGVKAVTPRIVGELGLGKDRVPTVVVGLPAEGLPVDPGSLKGRLFRPGASHELVAGSELARRLHLEVGALIPPFYRNPRGEFIFTVVGLFHSDLPFWQANLFFCSLETACEIFDQEGLVTSLLVTCDPGAQGAVEGALARLPGLAEGGDPGEIRPQVSSRDSLQADLPQSMRHLEGIFHLHFVLAFAVGLPLLMMASGLGLTERRREAALLKATGWMTDEVILRGMAESLVLALLGASLAVVLAAAWLLLWNGAGIAGIFLPGAAADHAFRVPFRLAPLPALLAFVISVAIVGAGTLYSTWRAATAAPASALR